jgi:hypothetical protein
VRGQHGEQAATRERTVADLAAPRSAQRADLADRVGREVVVQHEALGLAIGGDALAAQRVVGTAERARDDCLGLAAREQRRAVGSRQQSDFAPDRTDLGRRAAVEATPFAERQFARPWTRPPREYASLAASCCSAGKAPSQPASAAAIAARRVRSSPRSATPRRVLVTPPRGTAAESTGPGTACFWQPRELAQFGERLLAARDPLAGLADRRERIGLADLERLALRAITRPSGPVPTENSRSACSRCAAPANASHWPFTRWMRRPPAGPFAGTGLTCSAAHAARIARLSRSLLGSGAEDLDLDLTLRCDTRRGNSERIVRSISRLQRVS